MLRGSASRVGVILASFIPFVPRGFEDTVTRVIGEAFDAASEELHDAGQTAVV
jgi:hypothetical protein